MENKDAIRAYFDGVTLSPERMEALLAIEAAPPKPKPKRRYTAYVLAAAATLALCFLGQRSLPQLPEPAPFTAAQEQATQPLAPEPTPVPESAPEPTPAPTNPGAAADSHPNQTEPQQLPVQTEPTEPAKPNEQIDPPITDDPSKPTDPPVTDDPSKPTDLPITDDPSKPTDPSVTEDPSKPTDPPVTEDPSKPTDPPETDDPPETNTPSDPVLPVGESIPWTQALVVQIGGTSDSEEDPTPEGTGDGYSLQFRYVVEEGGVRISFFEPSTNHAADVFIPANSIQEHISGSETGFQHQLHYFLNYADGHFRLIVRCY